MFFVVCGATSINLITYLAEWTQSRCGGVTYKDRWMAVAFKVPRAATLCRNYKSRPPPLGRSNALYSHIDLPPLCLPFNTATIFSVSAIETSR